MRVLHIITTIDRGGAENQLLLLAREQVKLGLEVTVIPLKGTNELELDFKNYGIMINSNLQEFGFFKQALYLKRICKTFNVVHGHLPRAELACAIAKPKTLIVSKHNCEKFWPSGPRSISKILSNFVQWRSKRVIAISETVKRFLVSNEEVKEEKVTVVHYGYDPTISYANSETIDEVKRYPLIGTISRLVPQKDIPTLLRSFNLIKAEFPAALLLIIGDGPLKKELQEYAKKMNISQNIEWVGRCNNPLSYLNQLDVFVMTSLYEGFGLVVLEAMSKDVPVIASRNEAFSEIFADSDKQLFPVGDEISLANLVIKSLEKSTRISILRSQKTIFTKYNVERMIRNMQKVYVETFQ